MSRPIETQPARTALAWQRTGLSVLLVAGVLLRGAAAEEELLLVVPAGVLALAGLLVLGVLSPRRQRDAEAAARSGADARAPRTAAMATGVVVLAAVGGLAAELVLRT
jgi:putative membrane protein